jgi:hypothetical protein
MRGVILAYSRNAGMYKPASLFFRNGVSAGYASLFKRQVRIQRLRPTTSSFPPSIS